MRKIVMFNLVSLDGFFAGEDGNIDWHMVDDEFNTFAIEHTASFGTIIFGKTTYQIFEDFWPQALVAPETSDDDRKVAQIIDDADKIVFSKSLKNVFWKNSKLYNEISPEEIRKLKESPPAGGGKDMVIFGSGTIVQQFSKLGLIDEYRVLVNPIVLGKGKPLFTDYLKLKLLKTRTFGNGNVLLTYQPLP